MSSYKLLLFLHVVTVIVGLGLTFSYPFLQGFAERQGVAATRFVHQFTLRLDKMVVYPAAAVLFVFGLGLMFDDHTGYKDDFPAWLMVAIPWFLGAVAVSVFVQRKNMHAAVKALENVPDGKDLPAAYAPIGKRIQVIGGLLGLSIVVITFLMVWKPGQ
jgi:hypothetical protein